MTQRPNLPLLLFVLSAVLGAWIAYDRATAWTQFGLILAGVALYGVFARAPEQLRLGRLGSVPVMRAALAVLPALVTLFFLVTNDWSTRIGKLPWFDPVLVWLNALRGPHADLALNTNTIGGIIAAFLPLQVAALWLPGTRMRRVAAALLVGFSAAGLLLSESRGAWLALGVVAATWVVWQLSNRLLGSRPVQLARFRRVWPAVLAAIVLTSAVVVAVTPLGERLLALRTSRRDVWANSLDLVSDYPFTGLGLGGFKMAYSSYVLLVHVAHTVHAHNLFLDIWLGQGLLGLLAFVAVTADALRRRSWRAAWCGSAALAAVGVICLHGLIDDAFYGYGGWAIPLLLIPYGLIARSGARPGALPAPAPEASVLTPRLARSALSVLVTCLLAAMVIPTARAAWLANLGALEQTQSELAVYEWPRWPIQDAVRRSSQVDLQAAMGYYEAALSIDPANVTANRRLGQIELAREAYDSAGAHLSAAYAGAPAQRSTQQMLGECYAVEGEIGQAAALWSSIDVSAGQLDLREWWYSTYLGDSENARRVAEAMSAANTRRVLKQ